jgi:hypothetical protein
VQSVKLAMDCLQNVAVSVFGERLRPGVCSTDHSNGLRSGMQYISRIAGADGKTQEKEGHEDEDEEETTPHFSDWAHISGLVIL